MNYILLSLVAVGITIQQICQKNFNTKHLRGAYTFPAASALFATIFFIATSGGDFSISGEALLYSLGFALAYGIGTFAVFLAIANGSLSITSLIIQYSLIIPAIYGIMFWDESVDAMLVIGIILLIISLFFVNIEKRGIEKKITPKWCFYAFLAFAGNGACSTVQRAQQIACNGMYKNQVMIIALLIVVAFLGVFAYKKEKSEIVPTLKKGFWQYSICGLANGLTNLLVIVLALRLPASLMFPVISAGGIVLSSIVSVTLYKEKLSAYQIIGLVLGTTAIVVLNM